MLIDWFTVGAQALNFLILVWVLKHFLYHPILGAIDAREKKIAAELADAATKKTEAQKERDEFQHKNDEFDRERAALLNKASVEAIAEGQRLLDQAGRAADDLSAKRQDALTTDAHQLDQAIRQRTREEVFAIARKALADLADTSLEAQMADVFTRRLRGLDGPGKKGLGDALAATPDPALVRSTFDLPAPQRATIQYALNETFSANISLRYETTPDLISGIELTAGGQKVAWSIVDYLAALDNGVGELLEKASKPKLPAPSQPAASKNGKTSP